MIPKDWHIPGYDIETMLGKGGMATVYQARQQSFGREVALKILNPVVEDLDDFSSRFLRESLIAAKLHHSHIVQVYDVGQHENYFYICMEYLNGGDLAQKIRAGITLKETVRIIKQLADALDFAHRKNIIHRDIKPENILFREDGAAVLTDFGIAKELESQTVATLTGVIMGTPKYMSPEHIRGDAVDHRADIYALGIVFYRCLTNYVPFDGKDLVTTAYLQINEPVPTLPAEVGCFQGIINCLLAKEPEDRYQRGRDIVAALEAMDPTAYSADLTNLDVAAASRNAPPTVTRTASGRHSVKMPSPSPAGTVISARFRADPSRRATADGNDTILADHMVAADAPWDPDLDEPLEIHEPLQISPGRRRSKSVAALSGVVLLGALAFPANQYSALPISSSWRDGVAAARNGLLDLWHVAGIQPAAVLAPFVEEPLALADSDSSPRVAGADVMAASAIPEPSPVAPTAAAVPAADTAAVAESDFPAIPDRSATPDISATIAALLREAEAHMAKGDFRQPAADNAYAKYRQVLELEPGNAAALAGMSQIAKVYSDRTERAIAGQQFDRARGFLTELRTLAVDQTSVQQLEKKLAVAIAKRKEQEAQAAVAQRTARIEELLMAAGVDEQAGRIRTPFGNNALEKYQQILELDPDHSQAIHKLVEYGR